VARSGKQRTLERLLAQRNEHPERLASIDTRIRAGFERTLAVFVLDMCGFSRLTLKHGIIHYLALIQRMHGVVLPIVEARHGWLVKTEADNVFAVFERVSDAHAAALDVQAALRALNAVLPADWDVHAGIGIGYGPLLYIEGADVFGAEMNLASKLGEDLARAGDVLVTEAAAAKLKRAKLLARRARISGITLRYYASQAAASEVGARRQRPRARTTG
jgi:class 3 adenylate cyclase